MAQQIITKTWLCWQLDFYCSGHIKLKEKQADHKVTSSYMRYLIAIIFPPLAVLLCNRPAQAVLNFVLWLFCLVPGIVHGLLVVSQTIGDERQVELLIAVTGKRIPKKNSGFEVASAIVAIMLIAGAAAIAFNRFTPKLISRIQASQQAPSIISKPTIPTSETPVIPWKAPNIVGWTFDQVQAVYGTPVSKDKSTALATWNTSDVKFTARFEGGKVAELTEVAAK